MGQLEQVSTNSSTVVVPYTPTEQESNFLQWLHGNRTFSVKAKRAIERFIRRESSDLDALSMTECDHFRQLARSRGINIRR